MGERQPKIVAVDGPAGSGKSSICSRVCNALGWGYVNTGALYRAIGLLAWDAGVDLNDPEAVAAVVDREADDLHWDGCTGRLYHPTGELTGRLSSEEAGKAASAIAKMPLVREKLLPLQRKLPLAMETGGVLVDGRDIGTVVFPDADLKIFLTASLEERSKRRLEQMGLDPSSREFSERLRSVQEGIAARDGQDSGRSAAPLRQADDAIEVDTSGLGIEAVVDRILGLIQEKQLI